MFASDIDAVYIATPHVTHFDIASEAIAAGRHVLCEKPLGMNEREVRELAARAADAGVFLMEAMWMKFNPLYARLAQLIAEGVLGEVRSVRAAFGAAFPQDGSSRWMPGGSTLLDQGIYPVTLAHMLLGRPETVSRTRDRARGRRRPARGLHARLRGCALRAGRQLDGRVDRSVSGHQRHRRLRDDRAEASGGRRS